MSEVRVALALRWGHCSNSTRGVGGSSCSGGGGSSNSGGIHVVEVKAAAVRARSSNRGGKRESSIHLLSKS